jgi:hypothetical protein
VLRVRRLRKHQRLQLERPTPGAPSLLRSRTRGGWPLSAMPMTRRGSLPPETLFEARGSDSALEQVFESLVALDRDLTRMAMVLRETLDQLYDGQNTGRYRWDQLYKTEKTHCGTLVEINLQREFLFTDGEVMDFNIEGHEVDCKYSQGMGKWMIPN